MTSETALAALYRAVKSRLSEGGELWDTRAYADIIPAKVVRPYVIFFVSGGGESNDLVDADASYQLTVKGVSDNLQTSLQIAARLAGLVNNQGTQDRPDTALDAGDEWEITTSTQGRTVHLVESFANAQPIYHDGHVFDFTMGLKGA